MKRRLQSRVCLMTAIVVASGYPLTCLAQNARAVAQEITATNAAFTKHLKQLAKQVPAGFTVIVQPPFIVLGDESPAVVQRRATQTVKWVVDKLRQDYFKRDPQEIIDIWLFRDGSS